MKSRKTHSLKNTAFKVAALVISTVLILSLAEGIFSLASDRSLIRKLGWLRADSEFPAPLAALPDQVRIAAGSLTEGSYATPLDPEIGIQMKGEFASSYVGAEFHTDALGLRRRIGPPAEKGAHRIIVLGDSVAFGYGVKDDQTFAHYIEDYLAAATKTGAIRTVVRTAATPGWTTRNSKRFMLDHLDELDPDEVVFIPVGNDLDDAFSTLETGHRGLHLDAALGSRAPHRSFQYHSTLRYDLARSGNKSFERYRSSRPGRYFALYSGISPESRRRFERTIDDLEELERRLASRDCGLTIAFSTAADAYCRRLLQLMAARGSTLNCFCMLEKAAKEDTLERDAHFNARTIRAGAHRIASQLITSGRIPGAELDALPAIDERFRDNVPASIDSAARLQTKAEWDERLSSAAEARVELATGVGVHQIYGGIQWDGGFGIAFQVVLRSSTAKRVEVAWSSRSGPKGLYPLTLELEIGGVVAGRAKIGDGGEDSGTAVFEIPDESRDGEWIEIIGRASNWYVQREKGYSRLVSMSLRSITAVD